MSRQRLKLSVGCAVMLAGVTLSGCESTTPTYDTTKGNEDAATVLTVTGTRETRVLYADGKSADCVFAPTKGTAAIAALLVPALIDATLTTAKNALTAAGGAANATLQGYVNLPANSPVPQCVSVISGHFLLGADTAHDATNAPNWFNAYTGEAKAGQWQYLSKMLADQGVHLGRNDKDAPDFYFETRFIPYVPPAAPAPAPNPADSGKAVSKSPSLYLKLVPTFIAYTRPAEDIRTMFRPQAVADLNISIGLSFGDPSSKAAGAMDLGYIAAGDAFRLNYERMSCAPHAPATDPCVVGPFVKESPWVPVVTAPNQPMTLTATVTEGRTASRTVAFIATVFGSAQPSLNTAAQDELVPSKGRADKAAALEANAKIGTAYAAALKQTATDLLECDKYSNAPKPGSTAAEVEAWNVSQQQTLAVAKYDEMNLNGAAIAAGMDAPFPTIVSSPGQCREHYSSLAK